MILIYDKGCSCGVTFHTHRDGDGRLDAGGGGLVKQKAQDRGWSEGVQNRFHRSL